MRNLFTMLSFAIVRYVASGIMIASISKIGYATSNGTIVKSNWNQVKEFIIGRMIPKEIIILRISVPITVPIT